jgi:magnesium transporter
VAPKHKHRRRSKKQVIGQKPPVGAHPGTIVIPRDSLPTRIRVTRFGSEGVAEEVVSDPAAARELVARGGTGWIDVQGLGDREALEKLGSVFALHPLMLADAVNVPQRPKSESYDGHTFTIARRVVWKDDDVDARQISLIWCKEFLISIEEASDGTLEPVRERLRQGKGLLRRSGTDYLAYAILDTLVDGYLPMLEQIGERLEALEVRVSHAPGIATLEGLHELRHDLLDLRHDLWPQRDAVRALLSGEVAQIDPSVRVYLRDVHDHCVQMAEIVEVYREIGAELLNIYLTAVANRTNEVMKVLTIVSTIFIPLTFLVGVYGMNFEHMPELEWRWAYPLLWILMVAVTAGMLLYFRRRGWLGRKKGEEGAPATRSSSGSSPSSG